MFNVLSRHQPRLWIQPRPKEPDAIVLVFDHVPEGYRKACEWIAANWDGTFPLYRLIIPCSQDKSTWDLCDFERKYSKPPQPRFVGCVDMWVEDTVFALQRILCPAREALPTPASVQFATWPPPRPTTLSEQMETNGVPFAKLLGCGYCSERILHHPDPFTGLTRVQLYMIRQCQAESLTGQEVMQRAAAKFRLSLPVERLSFGNAPWIAGFGPAHGFARSEFVVLAPYASDLIDNPTVPPWLMNGPFPIPEMSLSVKFEALLKFGKSEAVVSWSDLVPECPPYPIRRDPGGAWVALPRAILQDPSACYLPYGVTMTEFAKSNQAAELSWRAVRMPPGEVPGSPLQLRLTFARGHDLLVYSSLESYAHGWYDMKIDRMVRAKEDGDLKDDRIAREYRYLREIYMGATVPRLTSDGSTVQVRAYLDETEPERKRRLIQTYGELHFAHLWAVPLRKLGANVLMDEDDFVPDAASAQERWLKDLQRV